MIHSPAATPLKDPQRHFYTCAEVQRLRSRIHDPAFAEAWSALTAHAERALAGRLMPPSVGGGWVHHYYCPLHSVPLDFDADAPGQHLCPVDGENITGSHVERAWFSRFSDDAAEGAIACSQVWLATDSAEHLNYAVDVLMHYAQIYPRVAPHGDIVGLGRVHGTALEESVWAIKLARLADDVLPALPSDQAAAVTDLLAQVLTQISSELMGKIHNIECWHLASQISLATVLGRSDVVADALGGEFGLHAQLRAGIRDDGWWAEGSPHYHFYMLRSVVAACIALRSSHPDIVASPRLRGMVDTPLVMLRPDLSLAALNDGWFDISENLGIAQYAELYERAWAIWDQPSIPTTLGVCYRAGTVRNSVDSLFYGPDAADLEQAPALPPIRAVHESSGYAVVADGDRSLLLKFGPHGGGHGHPDKLQIDLHVRGVRVMPDLGSPAYNSELQGPWIRQSLSHNTAAVAGISQPSVCGTLLSVPHDVTGSVPLVIDAGAAWTVSDPTVHGSWLLEPRYSFPPEYEGAIMRRLVLWSPNGYLIDLFAFSVPSGAQTDLAYRLRGELSTSIDPVLPTNWQPLGKTQEDYLRNTRAIPSGPWQATWDIEGETTRVWVLDPPRTTAVVAECPGAFMDEQQTMVLRSATTSRGMFVSVVDSNGAVRNVTVDDSGIRIVHDKGTDVWTVTDGHHSQTRLQSEQDGDTARLHVLATAWKVPMMTGRTR